jgi:hypothetical protein
MGQGVRHLFGKEGVAFGDVGNGLQQFLFYLSVPYLGHDGGHGIGREGVDRNQGAQPFPVKGVEQGIEGVAGWQFQVGAVGGQQDDRRMAGVTGQVMEKAQAGLVGRVQVVYQQHGSRRPAQLGQKRRPRC